MLARSGEAIPTPRHGPTLADESTSKEEELTHPTEPRSSQTKRGRKPRRPCSTGDDPFTLGNLDDDTPKKTELQQYLGMIPALVMTHG
jgi:hypothetical protein